MRCVIGAKVWSSARFLARDKVPRSACGKPSVGKPVHVHAYLQGRSYENSSRVHVAAVGNLRGWLVSVGGAMTLGRREMLNCCDCGVISRYGFSVDSMSARDC